MKSSHSACPCALSNDTPEPQWLAETVTRHDYVACYLDVDGLLYEVLRRLLNDGTLCLCDAFHVAWWPEWDGFPDPGEPAVRHFYAGDGSVVRRARTRVNGTTAHFDESVPGDTPAERRREAAFYAAAPRLTRAARRKCAHDDGTLHGDSGGTGVHIGDEAHAPEPPPAAHHEPDAHIQWWHAVGGWF